MQWFAIFGVREVGHDVKFRPRVFDCDVAFREMSDYFVLS